MSVAVPLPRGGGQGVVISARGLFRHITVIIWSEFQGKLPISGAVRLSTDAYASLIAALQI